MYTVDYFIKKFEAIPKERWCAGVLTWGSRCCAIGHCGVTSYNGRYVFSNEAEALRQLFRKHNLQVEATNDSNALQFKQNTPKERILAALYYIKKAQYPEITDPPVTIEDIIGEQVVVQSIELCGSQTTGSII